MNIITRKTITKRMQPRGRIIRKRDTKRRRRWRTRIIVTTIISPEILSQYLKSGM
jgi:hypothetical protein